ncbi:MAG TPA: primosomal protein N' [Planctomycetota bacterium]|nr:primosomal protein N' [Planctomycetota bacterium]
MARKVKNAEPDLFSSFDAPAASSAPAPAIEPTQKAPPVFLRLAEVAVEGPVKGTFTYVADAVWEQLTPGARVEVPFGHRTLSGFFIGPKSPESLLKEKIDPAKLKAILRVLPSAPVRKRRDNSVQESSPEALLTPTQMELARWMARHYACPFGATLTAMLPAGVKRGSEGERVRMVGALAQPAELLRRAEEVSRKKPKQAALLLALAAQSRPVAVAELLEQAGAGESALKALERSGLLRVTEERLNADAQSLEAAGEGDAGASETDLVLNPEQQAALTEIEAALKAEHSGAQTPGKASSFLLQGVTGSGKTEVYLRALKTVLALGKQGIVLVPEIALTPQTAQRFERRLGRERVAVLHSHITDGERADAWRAIRAGKIDVVVGARSALFAPLPRLGIVVIDEEHENAFKQETTPRYHARDVAFELARLSNAVLVLGSATPSFEAIYAARTGRMRHLHLSQRVAGRPLPPVEVVDMARENREVERYSYLSRRLTMAIHQTLEQREQIILFMNRRGFATVLTCLRCGRTEKCEQCDITLTSHRDTSGQSADSLSCHYCNFTKPVPDVCAGCGAPGIKHWGMGTERVEAEVKKTFPGARVARMDSDTMTRRAAYIDTLGLFRAGKIDILIGTQMIAKGLDFPNVTLVGVVLADTALHMPDFRSRERTFQLLSQVAGRAGRSDKGGRVIVQTHLPHDAAIRAAALHDFDAFCVNELEERKGYNYPPFSRLARIIVRSKDLAHARAAAEQIASTLKAQPQAATGNGVSILGPAEAPLSRLEGFYRQHVLIKARTSEVLSDLLHGPAGDALNKLKGAEAVVDVDAIGML